MVTNQASVLSGDVDVAMAVLPVMERDKKQTIDKGKTNTDIFLGNHLFRNLNLQYWPLFGYYICLFWILLQLANAVTVRWPQELTHLVSHKKVYSLKHLVNFDPTL